MINREFKLLMTIPTFISIDVNIEILFFGYIGTSIESVVVEIFVSVIQWYYSLNIIDKNLMY